MNIGVALVLLGMVPVSMTGVCRCASKPGPNMPESTGGCAGSPCIGDNRECFRDQTCLCTPGFHEVSETNDNCVESCQVYNAISYNDYLGRILSCSNPRISNQVATNLTTCKSFCSAEPGCISVGFDSDIDSCDLWDCDPSTTGAVLSVSTDANTLSVRNCAPIK